MTILFKRERKNQIVKGYYVPNDYMGFVESKYKLFASENDYLEYMLINLDE